MCSLFVVGASYTSTTSCCSFYRLSAVNLGPFSCGRLSWHFISIISTIFAGCSQMASSVDRPVDRLQCAPIFKHVWALASLFSALPRVVLLLPSWRRMISSFSLSPLYSVLQGSLSVHFHSCYPERDSFSRCCIDFRLSFCCAFRLTLCFSTFSSCSWPLHLSSSGSSSIALRASPRCSLHLFLSLAHLIFRCITSLLLISSPLRCSILRLSPFPYISFLPG